MCINIRVYKTMVKKLFFFKTTFFCSLLTIATALFIYSSSTANAKPTTTPKTNKSEEATETFGTPVKILADGFFAISFFQQPVVSENKFTIRLSHFGTVEGCAHLQRGFGSVGSKMKNINRTGVRYVGNHMEFMLDVPMIANNDGEPRYTNYDCKSSSLEAYVDLPLNRDTIIKRKITQLIFKTPYLDLGTYDIDISKDRIIFKSKLSNNNPEDWLTLWFFPKNTIKLYVPEASSTMNVIQEIRDFGLAHGLFPMDEVLNGYALPNEANNYVYFSDPRNIFLHELSTEDSSKQFGKIRVSKTYYGTNGLYERTKLLPIYGTLITEQKVWE